MDILTGHVATFWGFVAGSALLIGAFVGYVVDIPRGSRNPRRRIV